MVFNIFHSLIHYPPNGAPAHKAQSRSPHLHRPKYRYPAYAVDPRTNQRTRQLSFASGEAPVARGHSIRQPISAQTSLQGPLQTPRLPTAAAHRAVFSSYKGRRNGEIDKAACMFGHVLYTYMTRWALEARVAQLIQMGNALSIAMYVFRVRGKTNQRP